MKRKEAVERLREIGIIYKETVRLRSGKTSDYYCDIKKAYGEPDLLNFFADEVGKLLSPETTCIAASGYGGLPLASCVASRCNKKLIAVRDTEKKHGRSGRINGYVPNADDVIAIVDDVLTTGSSINSVLDVLKTENGKVDQAIVIVKRDNPQLVIPYRAIFTVEDLL